MFPAVGKEFYFDWFGDNGFVEHQVLIPPRRHRGLPQGGHETVAPTWPAGGARHRQGFFGGAGTSFITTARGSILPSMVINRAESLDLLKDMDDINCRFGAITNVMKDSRLSAAVAEHQYSEYGEFRERLRSFDPKRRFTSCLSERLGL